MKIRDIKINNNEQNLALCEVLNLSIPELKINKDKEIIKKDYKKYLKIEKKLKKGIPIQYILKKANFYGKDYYVNKNVLVPRPETEVLVKNTQNLIKKHFSNQKVSILDIGTGSGVIAITMYSLNNKNSIIATDISKKALKVAKINQKRHNSKIKFIKTNLFDNISNKFDVIISNPPYIPIKNNNIEAKVAKYEPNIALYGGIDGLDYYRAIFKDISRILKKKHIIALEIGEFQGESIKNIIKQYLPDDLIKIDKDLNGFDRYIYIMNKNKE